MIQYVILFLIGALLVPVGDMVHVLTSTTAYPSEQMTYSIFGIIPCWVPFLFGFAGIFAGLNTHFVRKIFPRKKVARPSEWTGSAISFIGMYFLSGLLPKDWINDAVLAVCGICLFLFVGERSKGALIQTFGIIIGGVGFEILLVHFGIFNYNSNHNELFGVAPWLPWLYVGVAVAIDSFIKWWSDLAHHKKN